MTKLSLLSLARRSSEAALLLIVAGTGSASAQGSGGSDKTKLIVVAEQGSFLAGGTVVTNAGTFDPIALTPDGQTVRGDHAYVQYQIPPDARKLPLVFWHGGGQFSKTWETTPDGREGFQNIFLRRGFAVYNLDQPRRGRAGRSLANASITPIPGPGATGEQGIFVRFRIGIWPNYFPGVQFSRDPEALNQWWRQQTPDIGPGTNTVVVNGVAAALEKVGPSVLVTHSASGLPGFLTQIQSPKVKAIVAYEPVGWVLPSDASVDDLRPIPTNAGPISSNVISPADFQHLTQVPILLVYGDNIPDLEHPSAYPGIDIWRGRLEMARRFVRILNQRGGDATLIHLPDLGITGNTHFPMQDLNNLEVADLLSKYLKEKKLDKR